MKSGSAGMIAERRSASLDAAEVSDGPLRVLLRLLRRAGGIEVEKLVTLLGGSESEVPRLEGLLRGPGGAHGGGLVERGAKIADPLPVDRCAGEIARCLREELGLAGRLGKCAELGGDGAGARLVVNGAVGGFLDRLVVVEIAMLFEEPLLGEAVDALLDRLGFHQRADEVVGRREAEAVGDLFRVQALLVGEHPVGAIAELLLDRADGRVVRVERLDLGDVEPVRGFGRLAVDDALLEELLRTVDGLGFDLCRHGRAGRLAQLGGLPLQPCDLAAARIGEPAHVAQRARLEVVGGLRRRVGAEALIVAPLILIHA
jgi:hypothetical protein